jgi:sarcosine oxidase
MYDVIVIGAGATGSAALYHLAKRGVKALAIEQFGIPHDQGSYAGQSRLIRKAYFEHPDYVPLLLRAYENWRELEAHTGAQLYYETGLLYFGPPGDPMLEGVRFAAHTHRLRIETWSAKEALEKYPVFKAPAHYEALFEPEAGFLLPEKCVELHLESAVRLGATLRTREKVLEWEAAKDEVWVKTDQGAYSAARLIITAGAWAGRLMPALQKQLQPTRQVVGWVDPGDDWSPYELGNFPCWLINDPDRGCFYGFPALPAARFGGPAGLKVGRHTPGLPTDPDCVDRAIQAEDEEEFRYGLRKYLPGANGAALTVKTCLYTYSTDEHFILDRLPDTPNVSFFSGCSGHGYKFASVVGEILADLSLNGKTDLPAEFLKIREV